MANYISYPPCDDDTVSRDAERDGRAVQAIREETRRNFKTRSQVNRGVQRGKRGAESRSGLIPLSK